MRENNNIKKIVVLDNNYYYNLILTKQIQHFTNSLKIKNETEFIVNSYLNTSAFFSEIQPDTDLVILDFYLEEGKSTLSICEE